MNTLYFLQIFSYAPLYACLFGVLLLGFGLVRINISLIKAGLVLVLAGAGLAFFLVSRVESISEMQDQLWGGYLQQAQFQQWGQWAMGVTGVAALLGLFTTSSRPARARRPKVWAVIALVLSLGCLGLLVKTSLMVTPPAQASPAQAAVPVIPVQ
ncbi:hypothetical protein [Rufibacter sp. LB8]|uniref:hypothetical protein n=1 Tax=Rufibacter sp. LB8 TaxID=2777781 RepID=UPI00178C5C0E|nr:hypothetical protein [Rufibacter sp. LB8]